MSAAAAAAVAAVVAAATAAALRQRAETTLRMSWLEEGQMEELFDLVCLDTDYTISLADFVKIAEALAVISRCINLLYKYNDTELQQQS